MNTLSNEQLVTLGQGIGKGIVENIRATLIDRFASALGEKLMTELQKGHSFSSVANLHASLEALGRGVGAKLRGLS